ncbi:MAG TPA: hypothetical protein VF203_14690 [Burkholderiales bacterium]
MLFCDEARRAALAALLQRFGISLEHLGPEAPIPGSYWGPPEAGLIGRTVYVRADTPLHSALHEAAHLICMDEARRAHLHTDAGGDYAEENAVCYLQILLAGELGISRHAICADMDAWGYTFRLGSACAWFSEDADDARAWLLRHGLITPAGAPTWRCRGAASACRSAG